MRMLLLPALTLAMAFAAFTDARASGAYASAAAADAAACARRCTDDGLCVAWSYLSTGACELRANAPATPIGVAQGFSSRAPASLREIAALEPAVSANVDENEHPPADLADDETTQQLLGGLEEDTTGLRH